MSVERLTGSCLCGAVHYEIEGEPKRFYHCHCSRCRKASGTGHASNILVATDKVNWTKGEESVGHYKVPEAERFARWFCRQCGSSLPRFSPELRGAVIPAGSLDMEPGIRPQARIFWDSRTSWSCSADDDLPVFGEYPPQI